VSSYLCGLCDLIPFRKRGGRQRAHDLELEEESVGFGFIFGVGVMALLGTYGKRIKRCLVAKAKVCQCGDRPIFRTYIGYAELTAPHAHVFEVQVSDLATAKCKQAARFRSGQ
jgi:hypothetical protein